MGKDLFLCLRSLHKDKGQTEWGESGNHLQVQSTLEAESSLEDGAFWMLAPQLYTDDACFPKDMFPDALTKCVMCMSREGDCSHLFFECPFAQRVWTRQNITGVDVTSDEAFWGSLRG